MKTYQVYFLDGTAMQIRGESFPMALRVEGQHRNGIDTIEEGMVRNYDWNEIKGKWEPACLHCGTFKTLVNDQCSTCHR